MKTNCLNHPVQRWSLVTSLAGFIFFVFGSSVHFSSEPSHLFLNFAWRLSYPPVDTGLLSMNHARVQVLREGRPQMNLPKHSVQNTPSVSLGLPVGRSVCGCVGRCVGLSVCQSVLRRCVSACVCDWKERRCTEDELAQTRRRACSQ